MSIRKKVVWLPYDMDTAIGINNSGLLVFSYNLEDTDLQQGGEFVFNGQDSVMWTNLRDAFGDDIKAMYQQLRSSGAISYDRIEQMFETHQAKWSEAIFNEDAFYKYIEPLTNPDAGKQPDASYLPMAQGSKAEQRKWWLFNRFRYMDSKFNAGDALTDYIMMRAYAVDDQVLTPYADIYLTTSWDGELTQVRATRGQTYTLPCPKDTANDAVVAIYSASQLSSIGDLSGLKIKSGNFSMATRLTSLKVGDSDPNYSNTNLTDLQLGSNTLLSTLDVRNCPNLVQTIDIRGCTNIEEAYFEGTSIAAAQLPNGGVLRVLHLPETVKNLTIQNQPSLINFSIEGDDYSEITTLWLENAGVLGGMARTMLNDIADGSNVRLINVYWECADASEIETVFSRLDKMHGIDETGLTVNTAQVSGEIHTDSLTGAEIASFNARYPYIRVTADHTSSVIYFYNGSTLITQKTVLDGGDATYSGSTPTKTQDAQYTYSFAGWSMDDDNTVDSDALKAVTADRNVYACFTSTIRTYTVTWVNNGTTIETDTNVPYGTIPHYDGATPTKDGQTSTGWLPDPTVPITGDTTFTAQYLPVYTITFKNDTGTTTLDTQNVVQGGTATYGGTTPTSSEDASLAWLGWATSANSHNANAVLTNIQASATVYAAFESAVEVAEITDSWDTIIANIDNGTYSTVYKVGNYKPLDLGTEGTINMQIVGINVDVDANDSPIPLTFIGMELLTTTRCMNTSAKTTGGWPATAMRTYLTDTILPLVPSNVKVRINAAKKYSGGTENNVYTINKWVTYDKLWIPSNYEVSGTVITENVGALYTTIYSDNTSRQKTGSDYWWLRSISHAQQYYYKRFMLVSSSGTVIASSSSGDASKRNGIALGFCLGLEPETITDS